MTVAPTRIREKHHHRTRVVKRYKNPLIHHVVPCDHPCPSFFSPSIRLIFGDGKKGSPKFPEWAGKSGCVRYHSRPETWLDHDGHHPWALSCRSYQLRSRQLLPRMRRNRTRGMRTRLAPHGMQRIGHLRLGSRCWSSRSATRCCQPLLFICVIALLDLRRCCSCVLPAWQRVRQRRRTRRE